MRKRVVDIASAIAKKIEWLADHLGWICGGLSLIMMVLILREVVGRYFFNSPTEWVMEICTGLFVWATFLGMASTEMSESHVKIDFIYILFKGKVKSAVDVFIAVICLLWCSVIIWQSTLLAWGSFIKDTRSSSPIALPLFPWQMIVPIGVFLLFLILVIRLVKSLTELFQKR